MNQASQDTSVSVGTADLTFKPLLDWPSLPDGYDFVEAIGVATDSLGRAYIYNRGEHPVMVFEPDGSFVGSWGEGLFVRPHGISIGADDSVFCSDDQDHTVRKFTTGGELLLTLGTSGQPSETGATDHDYRNVTHGGGPFNLPTNVALAAGGAIYVSDGYGNARVHKFSAEGELLFSWGEPGSGPGQFHLPHGIGVDETGLVYVADRENSRIQVFDAQGAFQTEWTDVARPCQVRVLGDFVYVAELGFRAGMFPWMTPQNDLTGGRVSIFDRDGNLRSRWGGGDDPCAPGDFFAPHDIWTDGNGDVYVAEVVMSGGGNSGQVSPDCHTIQKFVLQK